MKYQVEENCLTIFLPKEVDHHQAEEIRKDADAMIERNHIKYVIFDFGETEFMDSSGIGMVMGRYKKIKALGGKAWIICNNPNATRILEMSGVFQFIQKCRDVHDAV